MDDEADRTLTNRKLIAAAQWYTYRRGAVLHSSPRRSHRFYAEFYIARMA